jgi:acyl carrier protein
LKTNLDNIVYDITKKIFQEVGIKVNFAEVRDYTLSRSRNLEEQIQLQKKKRVKEEQIEEENRIKEEKRLECIASILGISEEKTLFYYPKVRSIVSETLSVEEEHVTLKTDFRNDLNADSLDAVQLIMTIEEAFDIEIPDEAAEDIRNLEELIGYVIYKSSANKK